MRYLVFTVLILVLSACNLEPPYRRPCMEMPCMWRFEYDIGSTVANVRWWEVMGDSVLNQLIHNALANNNDLQVAIARVCEFLGRLQVARSQLFPQINFKASAIRERVPAAETSSGVPFITSLYSYQFNLSYELDFWGKIYSQVHAAYAQALASVEDRRTVILTLVTAVAEAYVQLRARDRELDIAFQTLEERREYLRLAILRFEGGLTSEIEVTQAAVAFEQTLADVTTLEQQIPQIEDLISVLIGDNPTSIIRDKAIDELILPCEIPAGLPSELLLRRPDILAAEFNLIAANAEIGVARAAFFPSISLTALYGGESFQLKNLFSSAATMWQYGVNIMQPIFTGGRLTGELNIAIAQKCEAYYTYRQTVLNAFKEVNDALIAYRQTKELVKVEKSRVAAASEYLHLSWLRYYNGQADYLVVLNAEQTLFETQISLTQAQEGVLIAMIELYKALGGGWVVDADCCLRCEK